eukprot:8699100-Lingulodinium_polyedra.AAC.1
MHAYYHMCSAPGRMLAQHIALSAQRRSRCGSDGEEGSSPPCSTSATSRTAQRSCCANAHP